MTSSAIEPKVEQLLTVLDEDVRHLETVLSQLDMLRRLLVQRDDPALETLLGEIRSQTQEYAANERMRGSLRTELARALGWKGVRLTLSGLRAVLPDRLGQAVAARQEQLKSLVQRLLREHALTAVLVSDCGRFNRTLLRTFLGTAGPWGITYSPHGAAKHQSNMATMSLQF